MGAIAMSVLAGHGTQTGRAGRSGWKNIEPDSRALHESFEYVSLGVCSHLEARSYRILLLFLWS